MRILGLLLSIIVFVSCLNDKNAPSPNQPIVVDTTTATNPVLPAGPAVTSCSPDTVYFQQTILPLITSNCAMSGCHDAISKKDGVILTDYTNIMREVKVASPTSSDLYKCLNETGKDRMPPAPAAEFSLANKALVLKWIQQGAKNNSCVATTVNCDTTGVSFSATVFPTLKTYCTGCHSGATPSAGIDLNSHAAVKVYAANGKLMGSINHSAGYKPMPSSTSKLGTCEISQIKAWIAEGTLNN
ncbi:hypothetical protein ACMH5Q_08845 [Aquirufa lenticrescens]